MSIHDAQVDSSGRLPYVLVTPARNERAFIEATIRSVIAQTVLPLVWVIVSDGSTDGMDALVASYAASHAWIEFVRLPERSSRHFAGKVHAFNAGYARLRGLHYDAIGSLDADISFDREYFEFLLGRLSENPALGVVGTPFEENGESYDYRFVSLEHVSGACQFFRRSCFEAIGGFVPMPAGGVDHVAVITARMKGWETRTFTEKTCHHQRKLGSASHGILSAKFHVGALDYALGSHPAWEFFRVFYQMSKRPWIIGGCMILAGYFVSLVLGAPRSVSPELMRFRRREQMARLKRFFQHREQQEASPSPPHSENSAPWSPARSARPTHRGHDLSETDS
jgi:poly-beta-1,6-N-acetyl-D-glucosamine synthase